MAAPQTDEGLNSAASSLMSEILKTARKRVGDDINQVSSAPASKSRKKQAPATQTSSSTYAEHVQRTSSPSLAQASEPPLRLDGLTSRRPTTTGSHGQNEISGRTEKMAALEKEVASQSKLWTQNANVMTVFGQRMSSMERAIESLVSMHRAATETESERPEEGELIYQPDSSDEEEDGDPVSDLLAPQQAPSVPVSVAEADFSDLEQFLQAEEKEGPKLEEKLAAAVNPGLRIVMAADKIKDLQDKYLRPSNCDNLKVPKVNLEAWQALSKTGRATDVVLQKVQTGVGQALIPTLRMLEVLAQNKNESQIKIADIRSYTTDIFKLLSFLFVDVTAKRKELIKPEMTETFQSICKPSNPATEWLFGDDLNSQVKTLNESKKVGQQLLGKRQTQQPLGQQSRKGNAPFLSRGYPQGGGRNQTYGNKYTASHSRRRSAHAGSGPYNRPYSKTNRPAHKPKPGQKT